MATCWKIFRCGRCTHVQVKHMGARTRPKCSLCGRFMVVEGWIA